MKMVVKVCLIIMTSAVIFTQSAYADLKTLMEVGQNQARIAKALKDETKNYESVKAAITAGKIKEGVDASSVRKKYGEPVFDNVLDEKKSAYKWLYMPATSTHFEGEKLYLFVDSEGKVVGWQLVE